MVSISIFFRGNTAMDPSYDVHAEVKIKRRFVSFSMCSRDCTIIVPVLVLITLGVPVPVHREKKPYSGSPHLFA